MGNTVKHPKPKGGFRPNSGRRKSAEVIEIEQLKEKILKHGSQVVEKTIYTGHKIKKERTLILLEMLFHKGSAGNVPAAKEYLDRVLGRPKESLNLQNDGGSFNSMSDAELVSRISQLVKED